MFCIGKLVTYYGDRGTEYLGCIEQICPKRNMPVLFRKDEAYKDGILIEMPWKVIGQPYVAYNLKENNQEPSNIRPELVSLLENVKPESLFRLINENEMQGEDIWNIIQKYCPKQMEESEKVIKDTENPEFVANEVSTQLYIDYLKSRGVKYFVHFTPVSNIDSIMMNGLRPRTEQTTVGETTDELRLDNKEDALSLSISFPNYQMFYSKRQSMTDTQFAVLKISIDALQEFRVDQIGFYPFNAASSLENETDFLAHCTMISLKEMFAKTEKRARDLPEEYTTNPQAEIMIKGIIGSKYITKIVFDDYGIAYGYVRKYGNLCGVDGKMFRWRSDFATWKKPENNGKIGDDSMEELPF